jgi:hypothetical protein
MNFEKLIFQKERCADVPLLCLSDCRGNQLVFVIFFNGRVCIFLLLLH